jgi:hypothetical protein
LDRLWVKSPYPRAIRPLLLHYPAAAMEHTFCNVGVRVPEPGMHRVVGGTIPGKQRAISVSTLIHTHPWLMKQCRKTQSLHKQEDGCRPTHLAWFFWEATSGRNLECSDCRPIDLAYESAKQHLATQQGMRFIDSFGAILFLLQDSRGEPAFQSAEVNGTASGAASARRSS